MTNTASKISSLLGAAFLAGFSLEALAAPAGSAPATLPEWRMELVAEAPEVKHPSVVCVAPDGRVFVAEDPMDITAPANASLGRILCLHPNGKRTVFADGLFAVFGMQYIDGKLYVLHNPKFSVFADGGETGKDRQDLIESTNPNPWALDWNDHVPANFRLAMDGYLYMAVGDKGIYGAVGKDGKRVDLHGGGILRMRPDGTALEVHSRGVRNILDVAMNEEDEIFTYDNTDEQQWMGRLTHMVDGGFYGYPYDFIPRRPYTLWMMADYGPGAATGALAYNNAALPEEYRGNLFLADFGKRQVMRVKVEREGATYRAVSKEDLFPDPPADFRPVGIAWAADGLGMYICDWQHRDEKSTNTVGRLWKLTFIGPANRIEKPGWYVPAAQGQEFRATTPELAGALSHPDQNVRLVAQRRLADRGAKAAVDLRLVVERKSQPPLARVHALWALDAIDGGVAGRREILNCLADTNAIVRRQALRHAGQRGISQAVRSLTASLKDADASIRFQAAAALGRIGGTNTVSPLLAALTEKDPFARYAMFTALNRVARQDSNLWKNVVNGLASSQPEVAEATVFALRDTYDPMLVAAAVPHLLNERRTLAAREALAEALAELARQPKPWKGEWWAYHPVNALPPAKTEDWVGTTAIFEAFMRLLESPDSAMRLKAVQTLAEARYLPASQRLRIRADKEDALQVRKAIVRALGVLQDVTAETMVEKILRAGRGDPLFPDAVDAAANMGGESMAGLLLAALEQPGAGPGHQAMLVSALGRMKSSRALPAIAARLGSAAPEVREAAVEALARYGEAAVPPAVAALGQGAVEAGRDAARLLGKLRSKSAIPGLLQARGVAELREEAAAALALIPDERAAEAYLEALSGKNAALRESSSRALAAVQDKALPAVLQKLDALPPETVAALRAVYAKNPEAQKSRLFAVEVKAPEPKDYEAFALRTKGDPKRGRLVYENESGVACIKCHKLGQRGGQIGPDLSGVGTQFDRAALIESVLHPSKVVREGYNPISIETKDDQYYSGLFKGETSGEIMLLDSDGRLQKIPKGEIKNRTQSQLSLMPEGLAGALSMEEFADLIAFLETLKGAPAPAP